MPHITLLVPRRRGYPGYRFDLAITSREQPLGGTISKIATVIRFKLSL